MEQNQQARETTHIDIGIGDAMILDLVGVGGSFKTSFVGMIRSKFLIVKMPAAPELREHFYQDKKVMVKYLAKGQIHVFRTSVASVGFKPAPLLYLDYPVRIDSLTLRKAKRLECFFPAKIVVGELELVGSVVDLSLDGCRMILPGRNKQDVGSLAVDTELTVKFAFFSLEYDFEVRTRVKNVLTNNMISIGLKFHDMKPQLKQGLEEYFRIAGAVMPED